MATAVCSVPSSAQVLKGSISGTVVDPHGAVVAGAHLKATQNDTGAVFQTISDHYGLFHFSLIPAGTYVVEAAANGFKTSVQREVAVTASVDTSVGTLHLTIGESSTTVEVTARAPLVEATQSQVTTSLSGESLQNFAGIQDYQGLDNLAMFVPGITSTRDASFANINGIGVSVDGLRGRNNDQQIDGQHSNDNTGGGPSLFVFVPAFLDQYVVVSDQFGPEYGRNSGSVINLITKSGTNNWHGNVFASGNNSALNTLTNNEKRFHSPPGAPTFNEQHASFTIGGPAIKNKLFLFAGFNEREIYANGVFASKGITPTPAGLNLLNGCFPNSTSLQVFDKFGPYAIASGSPQPLGAATLIPVRSGAVTCPAVPFAPVERTLPIPVHTFDWIVKSDLLRGRDSLTSRYLANRGTSFDVDSGAAANGYPFNAFHLSQAILESWTHSFSPRMANEARISFNRLNADFGGNEVGDTVPTGANLQHALAHAVIQAAGFDDLFGIANSFPGSSLPLLRVLNTWEVQDNWTFSLHKHQLKAGASLTYQRSINNLLPNIDGVFQFPNWGDVSVPNTPGCPNSNPAFCIQGFVSNVPNQVRIANGSSNVDFREYETFIYAGDDWKIGQNLTVNLGITWSYFGQPENLFNEITTQRESNPGTAFWAAVNRFNGLPIPLSARTDPAIPAIHDNFGPGVGFAYSPQWGGVLTGGGKTVVRGGYRLIYDPAFYQIYLNVGTGAPRVFLQSFTGASASTKGLNGQPPTGDNVRSQLAAFLQTAFFDPREFSQVAVSPNFAPAKVDMWSLGIERQITRNSAFEARYAGNHARNLFQVVNSNPFIADLKTSFPSLVPANLTPCPAVNAVVPSAVGRVNCNQGIVETITNGAFSNYNALQLEFRASNLLRQLTLRTGYTFSKTLDNASEISSTLAGGNTNAFAQNPLNTGGAEYSFSGLDVPHAWTLSFLENLPFFKGQHGWLSRFFGGWTLSGTYLLTSGQRYTPSQKFSAFTTGQRNYYDVGFISSFVGIDVARPFIGSLDAPPTTVGIFAGDACKILGGTASQPICQINPDQLVLLNSLNQNINAQPVPVTPKQVRFIVNAAAAQRFFGTPFGNAPRNISSDARRNVGNLEVLKHVSFNERSSFEIHASFLNVFNHPNSLSIDPFVEDAGLTRPGTGFADPTVTNSFRPFVMFGGTRVIELGVAFHF